MSVWVIMGNKKKIKLLNDNNLVKKFFFHLRISATLIVLIGGTGCQSALKSIHLTVSNNVQQYSKVILFLAPFYAA
jgi:hypothetical protein